MSKTTLIKYGHFKWIDIVKPDEESIKKLKKEYDFHELDLEDCLSENQRSKIDEYEDYLFIVLHFPHYDKRRKRIVTEEIDCFIGQDYIITLHEGQLKAIVEVVDQCQKNKTFLKENLEKGSGYFLYVIIRELFDDCFTLIDGMEKTIVEMENDLFEGDAEKDMVRDILWLKKDVIRFNLIIAPQRAVIAQLEHKNKKFLPPNLEVYFDDVVDKIEKIWSNLERLKEMTESLKDANEILISHQTNQVIKTLTVFSVVLLPLTVITGFYGMNVSLPKANHEWVVWGITLSMVGLVSGMLAFFKWKRWI
ncbi:MAG: hypothetical protein ACD_28C00228G0005 [uncultured bacterium]|nr:MAG: hypothetical protein ACD_28C00228G0005 [uncultured bacterium]